MSISTHRRSGLFPRRPATRGQAQVEFALVVVLLMILILSMLEVLMLMHTYNVLADAAKEGVRYAIVHGTGNSMPSGPTCPCVDIDGPPAPPGTVPGYGSGYGVVATYAQYSLHDVTGWTASCSSATTGTICVTYPDAATATKPSNATPNRVQVVVAYPYSPFFNLGWPTVTVSAAAEGRIMN
jgi:hypothetical protein